MLRWFHCFNSIKVRLIPVERFRFHIAVRSFNSIKVRLIRLLPSSRPIQPLRFQFHKGSINTLFVWRWNERLQRFNSIKVRLIHPRKLFAVVSPTCFNSIKVRLILIFFISMMLNFYVFQFHKGSINTKPPSLQTWYSRQFQFHKGSINT